MDRLGLRSRWTMRRPVVDQRLAIDPNAVAVLSSESDDVVAALGGRQNTRPADRIVLRQLRSRTGECPYKIHIRVDTLQRGLAFELDVVKVFGVQSVPRASLVGVERGLRNGAYDRTDQTCPLHEVNFGFWKALPQTRKNGDRRGWRTVVIAFQRIETVGIGANHRYFWIRLLQRKKVIFVLQQDERFARGSQGKLAMRRSVVGRAAKFCPWNERRRIEHSQAEASGQGSLDRCVHH